MLPTLVTHADWGSHPEKRWMAKAVLRADGHYTAHAPELVGEPGTLVERLVAQAGPRGCVLLGFDFPIGLPARYAECVCIRDFLALLPQLGHGDWSEFYTVAERPDQIGLRRPFYPQFSRRKGEARLSHLLDGLGLEVSDLRRRCEQARSGRRAASPLFWTVGGQQVGKAAISGWKDVLGPALCSEPERSRMAFLRFAVQTSPSRVHGHCRNVSRRILYSPGRAISGQPARRKIGQARATRSSGECAGALGLGQNRARQAGSGVVG